MSKKQIMIFWVILAKNVTKKICPTDCFLEFVRSQIGVFFSSPQGGVWISSGSAHFKYHGTLIPSVVSVLSTNSHNLPEDNYFRSSTGHT